MKKTLLAAAALLGGSLAWGQGNEYALPKTSIRIEVQTQVENFHAGPYAAFAKKLLNIDALVEDKSTCNIISVKLTPLTEADASQRFFAPAGALLQLSAQGLISLPGDPARSSVQWRFPVEAQGDFAQRGISSNFANEKTTLYKTDELGQTIAVTQSITAAKSLEKRAAEAAEMVLKMRQTRIDVITGNTDMTYSGEAMEAALNEMKALEKEYLSLFIGYTVSCVKTFCCEITPDPSCEVQKYVAFRLSSTEGPVGADDLSGMPVILELTPETVPETLDKDNRAIKGYSPVKYRIPAICNVRLSTGSDILLEDRLPIAQLGSIGTMYVK